MTVPSTQDFAIFKIPRLLNLVKSLQLKGLIWHFLQKRTLTTRLKIDFIFEGIHKLYLVKLSTKREGGQKCPKNVHMVYGWSLWPNSTLSPFSLMQSRCCEGPFIKDFINRRGGNLFNKSDDVLYENPLITKKSITYEFSIRRLWMLPLWNPTPKKKFLLLFLLFKLDCKDKYLSVSSLIFISGNLSSLSILTAQSTLILCDPSYMGQEMLFSS